MTPEQAVFGRSLRFTEQAIRDDDEIMMQVLGAEGPAWKAQQIRVAAKMMLLEQDACAKVRRAMLGQAPPVIAPVMPGTRVYFWAPSPLKGGYREDSARWRGPAVVITKESEGRYYLAWRGQVLLVA